MTDCTSSLRHRLESTQKLRNVVSTMKTVAASNVSRYERAVQALADYHQRVELGLWVCLRTPREVPRFRSTTERVSAESSRQQSVTPGVFVVFGSDQGLVGHFNDEIVDRAVLALRARVNRPRLWVVGERVASRLRELGFPVDHTLQVPGTLRGITRLVGDLLVELEQLESLEESGELSLYFHRPLAGTRFEPTALGVLPLDEAWRERITACPWPTAMSPETLGEPQRVLRGLLHEYLFVAVYRALAQSLACENLSRLFTMQRAEKSINERLEELTLTYHRLRQGEIDEELFDVIAGFESLGADRRAH